MNDLDRLKKVEIEVMEYYVKICKKYGLTYYLFWGTLLGAVRHKGFIPWDDDIDVVMMPDEYLKFLEVMQKEQDESFYLQNIYNTKYCTYLFSKIRKNHTTMVEKNLNYLPFKKGINIDVFPLIKYPNSKWQRFLFMYRFRLSGLIVNRDVKCKGMKNNIIRGFLHLFPRSFLNKIVIRKMEKLLKYQGDFSEYRVMYYKGFNKDWFSKIELPFEDKMYTVPKDYDQILTVLYGDYMTPPPEDKRYGHGMGNLIISFDKDYDELR